MIVEGDIHLMRFLYRFMFLRSGQLAHLASRSGQSIRRRMRHLIALKCVVALERAPMEEKCYTLGPAGYQLIADDLRVPVSDLPFTRRAPNVASPHWRHALMVNDTAITLYLAAQSHPQLVLHDIIHEFQLENPREKEKHKKFLLFEELSENGKSYSFRPDCLFMMYGGVAMNNSMAFFLEADRGSEAIGRIESKYEAYRLYYEQKLYTKFDAKGMRCLFVLAGVKGKARIASMRRRLESLNRKYQSDFARIFRFTHRDLLNEKTIIDSPIWQNVTGQLMPLYRPDGLNLALLYEQHRDFLVPFYGQQTLENSIAEA